jgi:hypothetical protein
MEAQHDILVRYVLRKQQVGDSNIGAVVFYVDFTVPDVAVNQNPVNAPRSVPPDFQDLIMVVNLVKDQFSSDRGFRRKLGGDAAESLPQQFAVAS